MENFIFCAGSERARIILVMEVKEYFTIFFDTNRENYPCRKAGYGLKVPKPIVFLHKTTRFPSSFIKAAQNSA